MIQTKHFKQQCCLRYTFEYEKQKALSDSLKLYLNIIFNLKIFYHYNTEIRKLMYFKEAT